jgi:hypothetical protein
MVTVLVKGIRKTNYSYCKESYLLGKIKAGIVHTEEGIILTITDMELSGKLFKLLNDIKG